MKHLRTRLFGYASTEETMRNFRFSGWPAAFAATAFADNEHWVATWAASVLETVLPPAPIRSFNNQTVRMVVNTSIPGRTLRVELSNTFGKGRLKIAAAHIAHHDQGAAIIAASDCTLTFSGNATAVIPAGQQSEVIRSI